MQLRDHVDDTLKMWCQIWRLCLDVTIILGSVANYVKTFYSALARVRLSSSAPMVLFLLDLDREFAEVRPVYCIKIEGQPNRLVPSF